MCLAIPARIVSKDGETARIEKDGVAFDVNLSLLPEARVGDYVLVHAGFALSVLPPEEARESLAIFAEIAQLTGS